MTRPPNFYSEETGIQVARETIDTIYNILDGRNMPNGLYFRRSKALDYQLNDLEDTLRTVTDSHSARKLQVQFNQMWGSNFPVAVSGTVNEDNLRSLRLVVKTAQEVMDTLSAQVDIRWDLNEGSGPSSSSSLNSMAITSRWVENPLLDSLEHFFC